jgi:hypothetical protein
VEDITEALWGTRVSPSTVSNLNEKIYARQNSVFVSTFFDVRSRWLRRFIGHSLVKRAGLLTQ